MRAPVYEEKQIDTVARWNLKRNQSGEIVQIYIICLYLDEGEAGRKTRVEIAQLVLHPSSVWIGCQLDTGNIH